MNPWRCSSSPGCCGDKTCPQHDQQPHIPPVFGRIIDPAWPPVLCTASGRVSKSKSAVRKFSARSRGSGASKLPLWILHQVAQRSTATMLGISTGFSPGWRARNHRADQSDSCSIGDLSFLSINPLNKTSFSQVVPCGVLPSPSDILLSDATP